MRRTSSLRLGLLSIVPIIPLVGLLTLCLANPAPQAKPSPFPYSLFAQAKADDYLDEENCVACHAEAHAGFEKSPHKSYVLNPGDPVDRRGCQSCHGPGGPHVANLEKPEEIYKYILSYTKSKPLESAMGCLRCHNDSITVTHWRRNGHAQADVSCVGCHRIHQNTDAKKFAERALPKGKNAKSPPFIARAAEPKMLLKADEATLCGSCHAREVGEFRQNFHHPVPEGRLVCSDCHEIHPRRAGEKQTAAQTKHRSVREMCVSCHAETAGPFAFEHDPVAGHTGDACLECHRPHGSHNPKMLNTFSRGACNQCHTDKANTHFPGRTCWQAGCHVAVHGSNTDKLLLRR